MSFIENFRAFNFALVHKDKYGFVGAIREYKKQRRQLREIGEKIRKIKLRRR